jgi:cell wall-associated NlpC family hydrolase
VGIVVDNKNGFITMIHSSTSQGIVVTDIDTSNYWKNRVHSYGTFLKD